jgi:glycolate oxidase
MKNNTELSALRKAAPNLSILTSKEECYSASFDNLRLSRMPSAVLKPQDEDEVEAVLKVANKFKIPVTTRGAGSATTGATSPVENGWVLDLSSWKNVHIDPVAHIAYAQPGATVQEVDKAAAQHGLFYPPDPGSKKYATIGGTIATNAGGLRGAKYGVTRDYVIALEGFMPSGDWVRWGANLKKFASGFNMRDLWIGSEGMLGVITGSVLKLIPRPQSTGTALALFPSEKAALQCAQNILKSGLMPSILEFLDSQTIECTVKLWQSISPSPLNDLPDILKNRLLSENNLSLLLLEFDGSRSIVSEKIEELAKIIPSYSKDFSVAKDSNETEALWKIRRSCSQAMFQLAPRKLNEDVVVPFESQIPLIEFTKSMKATFGLATPTFGHAADGNFHVHVMYDSENANQSAKAKLAIKSLMEKVIDLGGAITGEHGIGLAKSIFFDLQHSPQEISSMKAVKAALDPNNILNPHLLWTPTDTMLFQREQVRLPWDH